MRLDVQYLTDSSGNKQAIQLSLSEWEKLMNRLKKYEQTLKLKTDLQEAFDQVARLQQSKSKKQTLYQFLDEL